MMLSDLTTEDLIDMVKGPVYKMKIGSLYDDVFRKHMKYEVPIFEGEEFSERDYKILEVLLEKINEHFNEDK